MIMDSMNDIYEEYGISPEIRTLFEQASQRCADRFARIDAAAETHEFRVIRAMQHAGLSERHFLPATGYGYDDAGRQASEQIFAEVFGAEAALVRPHISSGTHAISLALYGVLRPGDELYCPAGAPYDTVRTFIGAQGQESGSGTLSDFGVTYNQTELRDDGTIDIAVMLQNLKPETKMVYLQRSTGYSWRPALTLTQIGEAAAAVHEVRPDIVVFTDNCYGEFLDTAEPPAVGVDLIAGSLIKNPGGGFAPTGGYVAGRADLVELAACRLAAPGVAGETGATLNFNRTLLEGFFIAPTVTAAALKSAVLAGEVYQTLGYAVCPEPDAYRSDIIESIRLGDPEAVKTFCRAIQEAAPVDSFVTPEPWDMPGYEDQVIMAAGAFIQGSSIEMSADAPMKEPWIVYFQGGLTHAHGKLGLMLSVQRLADAGLIGPDLIQSSIRKQEDLPE
ncbi:MAG: aminotransferase class I/II-fold pyridoxal phosphate-dependent enzyme [Eubacteriaceae bacterium]|jgi:cystathionine beta-lyase family protein involved in aluminum resistance